MRCDAHIRVVSLFVYLYVCFLITKTRVLMNAKLVLIIKQLALLTLALFIVSCAENGATDKSFQMATRAERAMAVETTALSNVPPVTEKLATQPVDKKKIIRDGRLGLKVADLEKTKAGIDTLVTVFGGYYANESLDNSDYESSYQLKIRIPSVSLDQFILKIETGKGQITYKEVDARDVTAEFIDFETRLANKRSYLKRYNDLLKQATSVKDILEIEEKTRIIEEEIESSTGRLNYLSDLVAFSTLDLRITKVKEFRFTPGNSDKFTERLKQSLSNGWNVWINFLLLLVKLWPFWVMVGIFIPVWKRFKRRVKSVD